MPDASLRLRPCVIAGETAPGDCSLFRGDELVGRIRHATEHRNKHWVWSVTAHIPGFARYGHTASIPSGLGRAAAVINDASKTKATLNLKEHAHGRLGMSAEIQILIQLD